MTFGKIYNLQAKVELGGTLPKDVQMRCYCIWDICLMTSEELLKRYAAGERDFRKVEIWNANLIKADLREVNLSGAELRGACLIAANLSEANLDGIRLEGSDLTSASLYKASLRGAGLESCQLINTNCREVDMTEAKLFESRLDGALFFRANLYNATLSGSTCVGTDFGEADMRRAFCNCGLSSSYFKKTNLLDAIEFSPSRTDIFIETIMPDGSVRDSRPLFESEVRR